MNYENLSGQFMWSLDIETAGSEEARLFHDRFQEDIKAPSNYKDQEKIDAYIAEKKTEIESKDALSWMTGKIVSIAMVNVADSLLPEKERKHKPIAFCGFSEKQVLEAWLEAMNNPANSIYQVIGKNSILFDFPFIKGRLVANKLKAPVGFKNSYNLLDIDYMLCSRSGSTQVASLDKMTFAAGLGGKTMKGSFVPKLYKDALAAKVSGNNEKVKEIMTTIKEYNIKDAELTAQFASLLIG